MEKCVQNEFSNFQVINEGALNYGINEQRNLMLYNVFPTSHLSPNYEPPHLTPQILRLKLIRDFNTAKHSQIQYHLYLFNHQ